MNEKKGDGDPFYMDSVSKNQKRINNSKRKKIILMGTDGSSQKRKGVFL